MAKRTLKEFLERFPEQGGIWIGAMYTIVAYDSKATVYYTGRAEPYIWHGWGSDLLDSPWLQGNAIGDVYWGMW